MKSQNQNLIVYFCTVISSRTSTQQCAGRSVHDVVCQLICTLQIEINQSGEQCRPWWCR